MVSFVRVDRWNTFPFSPLEWQIGIRILHTHNKRIIEIESHNGTLTSLIHRIHLLKSHPSLRSGFLNANWAHIPIYDPSIKDIQFGGWIESCLQFTFWNKTDSVCDYIGRALWLFQQGTTWIIQSIMPSHQNLCTVPRFKLWIYVPHLLHFNTRLVCTIFVLFSSHFLAFV